MTSMQSGCDKASLEGFEFACLADDVLEGGYVACEVSGESLLICRCGGQLSAIENRCSHMSLPLAGGRMIGSRIICPQHGAAFDIKTGKALTFPAFFPIRVFPLAEHGGGVYVGILREPPSTQLTD
jgi:nitrite reductase/ring-hydroxylating ferredoxin subunit